MSKTQLTIVIVVAVALLMLYQYADNVTETAERLGLELEAQEAFEMLQQPVCDRSVHTISTSIIQTLYG